MDKDYKFNGGESDATVRLAASETTNLGDVLVTDSDGFAAVLTTALAGRPFGGFALRRVLAKDYADSPADGDVVTHVIKGLFFAVLPITGVAQDDVAHRRAVYASDNGVFGFIASGTLIGAVWEFIGTNSALVLCATAGHEGALDLRRAAIRTLAATGNEDISSADLGKLIIVPNTGAKTLTLPAVADCAGRSITFKKTTADAAAITLDGAGAETIDGAATFALMDANNDFCEIYSTGAAWLIIARHIA